MGAIDWLTKGWGIVKSLWGAGKHLVRGITKTAGILKPIAKAADLTNRVFRGMNPAADSYGDLSEAAQWAMYGT